MRIGSSFNIEYISGSVAQCISALSQKVGILKGSQFDPCSGRFFFFIIVYLYNFRFPRSQ